MGSTNSTAKMFCLYFLMCVANISAHLDEMVGNYTFTSACMYAGIVVAMDIKSRLLLPLEQEDVLSVRGCFDFRAKFA